MQTPAASHADAALRLGVGYLPVKARDGDDGPRDEELASAASDRDDLVGDKPTMLERVREAYVSASPHLSYNPGPQNIVFGEGDPDARLMFVGEAPGADEDATGRPFVGRAGQLLEKMIVAMGLSRETVYIANVLKARPPGNATPSIEQAEASAPYLLAQIGVIRPEVIVTLGLPASRLLLGSSESMGRLRGAWHELALDVPMPGALDGFSTSVLGTAVMPTYHPAYLLRAYTSENRSKVWSDLRMVMERLGLPPG